MEGAAAPNVRARASISIVSPQLSRTNQGSKGKLKGRHRRHDLSSRDAKVLQSKYDSFQLAMSCDIPVTYIDLGMQKLHTLGYKVECFSHPALDCHQLPQQAVSSKDSCTKKIHLALHTNKVVGSHSNARRKYYAYGGWAGTGFLSPSNVSTAYLGIIQSLSLSLRSLSDEKLCFFVTCF